MQLQTWFFFFSQAHINRLEINRFYLSADEQIDSIDFQHQTIFVLIDCP